MDRFFTVETEARQQFYQVPKAFMCKDSKYFKMNPMSKLLYGILADRNSLSMKNGWVDKLGRIYFVFNQSELCDVLGGIDPKTLRKYLKELEIMDLLFRKRIGLKQPDHLYLLQVEAPQTLIKSLMGNNSPSRQGKIPHQEGEKFPPNNTNNNNTEHISFVRKQKPKNKFNDFPERNYSSYDLSEIEKKLLNKHS